jgi:hypothetical protein
MFFIIIKSDLDFTFDFIIWMQEQAVEDELRIYRKTWALIYTIIIVYYAL